jgi:tetratricopeptide (TPR) repeat protein
MLNLQLRSLTCATAFALLLVVTTTATAKPVDPKAVQARQLFESGTAHYNLGEYDKALVSFQDGYRIKQDPALLFNIGQCQRQLGQYEDAARVFRAYLRESSNPVNREEVQKLIGDMDRMAAERAAQKQPTGTTPPEGDTASKKGEVAVVTPLPPPAPEHKRKQPTWVWVTVGIAAAVVAGTAVGLGVGLSQHAGAPDSTLGTFGATFQ